MAGRAVRDAAGPAAGGSSNSASPSASVSALIYCGTPPGRCFDERDRLKVCDIVQVAGEKYAVVVDIGMVSYVLNTGQPK